MKRNLYSLLLVMLPLAAVAQPTLQVAQDYNIGTIIKYKKCSPVSPGSDGPNMTWNFTTLNALGGSDTLTMYYEPAGTVYAGAGVVERTSDSVYTYFAKTTSANAMIAFADSSAAGQNVTLTYLANSAVLAKRPLTYQLNSTDTFTGNLLFMGFTLPTTGTNTTNINVAGWGTLYLPIGTYNNVLKVRTQLNQTNTLSVPPTTVNVNMVSYMWFDADHKAPLLRIDSFSYNGTPPVPTYSKASTAYLLKETYPGNVSDLPNGKAGFNAYIDNDMLMLQGNFASKDYQLFLTHVAGQTLYTTEFYGGQLPLHFNTGANLPPGIYLVTVLEKNNVNSLNTIKIIKE